MKTIPRPRARPSRSRRRRSRGAPRTARPRPSSRSRTSSAAQPDHLLALHGGAEGGASGRGQGARSTVAARPLRHRARRGAGSAPMPVAPPGAPTWSRVSCPRGGAVARAGARDRHRRARGLGAGALGAPRRAARGPSSSSAARSRSGRVAVPGDGWRARPRRCRSTRSSRWRATSSCGPCAPAACRPRRICCPRCSCAGAVK